MKIPRATTPTYENNCDNTVVPCVERAIHLAALRAAVLLVFLVVVMLMGTV